jgi:hypothetical protein
MQLLPEKGKDYALVTTVTEPQRKWFDYEMAPIYMRVKSTGQEVFGSIPQYVPMEGSAGTGSRTDLLDSEPLPTLPSKAVHVGDSWQSQFQEGVHDLNNPYETESVVIPYQARGEFVDTEWESGHPCAKIRHIIAAGTSTSEGKKLRAQGAEFSDDKISVEETIFFAMDTHQILKIIRDKTIERKVQNNQGGIGAGLSGPGIPGAPGVPGASGPGMPGPDTGGDVLLPTADLQGRMPPGMRNRLPGSMAGGPIGGPMGGQGRSGAPSPTQSAATFIRIRFLQTFTLEGN